MSFFSRNIGLIIKREYGTRVKKKSFIILTLLGPLLIAGVLAFVTWMGVKESGSQQVMIIDDKAPVFKEIKGSQGISYDYVTNLKIEDAKDYFINSNYSAILYIPKNIEFSDVAILYFKRQPSLVALRSIERDVQKVVEQIKLQQFEINPDDFYQVKTDFKLNPVKISDVGKESEVDMEKNVVGFVLGLIIYMFIFLYGVQVMRGVIEEKTNRIIEVIITSVKPFQLMMGKVIGVALVGLTQFVVWVILSAIFISIAQFIVFENSYSIDIIGNRMQMTQDVLAQFENSNPNEKLDIISPDNIINRINYPLILGMFLFYFLGGYLLYAAIFAAIGAAVDSETDTQQFMLPATLPLILAYMVSIFVVQNPEGPAGFWFSIIPFTSPIVMMVRIVVGVGDGGVPMFEVLLSMGLLIITFIAMVWLSGKIYKTGILMYGKKATFKELFKWLRN